MKKKIFKVIAFVLVVCCTTSCNNILDKGPLDSFTENDVWGSLELSQAFLYPSLNYATGCLINDDKWTDNDVIQDDKNASNINKEQIDRYFDAGWNVYGNIRKCNLVIQKMLENTTFSENDRKYLIAQAKMQRAMIYFSRARLFGKLMIIDRVLDPDENMQFPRTETIKDTYDFILTDLKEAVKDLPVDEKVGMLTKGAAFALMAEVALHGASYIENGQQEYYLLAKEASEQLFSLERYELDPDYEKLFNDFDYAQSSKEIILAQWRHENNTIYQDTWMQALAPCTSNDVLNEKAFPKLNDAFSGWPTMFPSVDLVNSYDVIDVDGAAKEWNKTSYYLNFEKNGGYVSDAFYKNRDRRFYATIVHDSAQYINSTVTFREGGNMRYDSRIDSNWGPSLSGYLYRKGMYEGKAGINTDPTNYHYVILRIGRSYLNYAEIMLRLNNIKEAITYINKTRVIHGGLPELPMTLSAEDTWNAYKKERRIELVHEGDRYWSLLRWGKAENKNTIEELSKMPQGIDISSDGKKFSFISIPYKASENEHVFTKKRYLFPVPEGERINNPSLDQNEGW